MAPHTASAPAPPSARPARVAPKKRKYYRAFPDKVQDAGDIHDIQKNSEELSKAVAEAKEAAKAKAKAEAYAKAAAEKAAAEKDLARACGIYRDKACPTDQSSTTRGGLPAFAVDGNTNTNYFDRAGDAQCTQTSPQTNPWWRVDFERLVNVKRVRVYNRADCCSDRLQGFNVYVGNNPDDAVIKNAACATDQNAAMSPPWYTDVTCETPVQGKFLYVQLPGSGKILTLAEVQVQGAPVSPTAAAADAAAAAIAASSSQYAEDIANANSGRGGLGATDGGGRGRGVCVCMFLLCVCA